MTDRTDITSKDDKVFNVQLQRFANPGESEDITPQKDTKKQDLSQFR